MLDQLCREIINNKDEQRSNSPQGGPDENIHGYPTNDPDVLKPGQPLPVFDPVPTQIAPDYTPSPNFTPPSKDGVCNSN